MPNSPSSATQEAKHPDARTVALLAWEQFDESNTTPASSARSQREIDLIVEAIRAAERRGRIAGLREAAEISWSERQRDVCINCARIITKECHRRATTLEASPDAS